MTSVWLRRQAWFGAAMIAATVFASPALAGAPLTPGSKIADETSWCTAAYVAQGDDSSYYLMTSGHCDAHDGSVWTYGEDSAPLGKISAQEYEENGETGTQRETPQSSALTPAWVCPMAMSEASIRFGMC